MRFVFCSAVVLLLVTGAPLAGEEAKTPSLSPPCVSSLLSSSATPNSTPALPGNPEPLFLSSGGECPPLHLNCFLYDNGECRQCGINKWGFCDTYMCSDGLLYPCCICGGMIC
jgi:hypothetical protein